MNNHTRDTKHIVLRVLLYLFVILVVLVTLYPYFVMFTTAAKSRAEIYSTDGTLLPLHWLWQNFKDIWTLAPLSRYFINSLIVAGGSTLIAIICGIPAAYALARMKFKGKKIFLGIVIISQMFAPVVLYLSTQHLTRPLRSGFCEVLSSLFLRKWNRQQLLTAVAKCLHLSASFCL